MKFKQMAMAVACVALLFTGCVEDESLNVDPPAMNGLYINEVYSSNPDWVELYNDTDQPINLAGYILRDDKGAAEEYVIPAGKVIAAKSFIVFDELPFGLSSSNGDEVQLLDPTGKLIDSVIIPPTQDGNSYGRATDGGSEWQAFEVPTKGAGNTGEPVEPTGIKLYINEVQAAPAGDDADFIELYNDEDHALNLSGFILQDDKGAAEEFVIPNGVTIAAKGFLVFSQVSPGGGASFTFGLGSGGDKVILLDKDRNIIDQVLTPNFGSDKGKSYARVGDGVAQWQVVDEPTKGQANQATVLVSLVGKIVINEVYTFADHSTVSDLDWIELYNTTDAEIAVGGLKLWESGGSEESWTIPAGKSIPGKGYLVIETDKEGHYGDPVNYPAWGLSKGPDEYIALAYANMEIIDRIELPSLNTNESYGRVTDGAANWQIFVHYTKGTENTGPAREFTNTVGLFVNEVYHDNTDVVIPGATWDTTTDFIELYNSTNAAMDLSGWEIYDDTADDSKKYTIPQGTVIPAKGFLVYDVFKENTNGPVFGLGVGGDWVFIYKPGKSELVDVIEAPGFTKDSGWRDNGYTCGRLTDGSTQVVIFTQGSKGASNNGKNVLVR